MIKSQERVIEKLETLAKRIRLSKKVLYVKEIKRIDLTKLDFLPAPEQNENE
jgi:hypothetical protein